MTDVDGTEQRTLRVVMRAVFGGEDEDNEYTDGTDIRASLAAGGIKPGSDIHVEFGSGDVVSGELVSIEQGPATAPDIEAGPSEAVIAALAKALYAHHVYGDSEVTISLDRLWREQRHRPTRESFVERARRFVGLLEKQGVRVAAAEGDTRAT